MKLSVKKDSELLETLFKEKGFAPNKSQLKAIKHIEGPLFLTAGPGSGKTRVLLWRDFCNIVNKLLLFIVYALVLPSLQEF